MEYKVQSSDFVKRQVSGSGKTFSTSLSFSEIAEIAENKLNKGDYTEGYRDGVVLIKLKKNYSNDFICPLVKITTATKLKAQVVKRRKNEESYIQIRAMNGENLKTDHVNLVLYRQDVLKETNEESTDADWELIAFMAIPQNIAMPMGPVTMMRNQLQKQGGTKGVYESSEWAASVDFWQQYAVKS